ncbi:histone-lysine N-methyltransferase SETMAR [Trichonephila inaurata madagascariensis]|uniref:Histone-lysine N-methyltransferase SETMAR n=1 Tax=Trichonephila inaurata madagascariensis TaxID=2747483 RepID=A0A8X7CCQ4_9ARAC|nr:histone-lysine N-methyltransferase SETMAR [Trichonephila inaurata madagascariensis]
MDEDRRWTLLELKRASGIEKRTVHMILRNELRLRKIAARWVLPALTEVQRWVYETELKRQSAEWRQAGSPRRQNVRQNRSPIKLMIIVTYDFKSVIVCHFVTHVRTVTAQYYRDFLVRQVRRGVRDKHPDLADSLIIMHDNARPHKAECGTTLPDVGDGRILGHPTYSP